MCLLAPDYDRASLLGHHYSFRQLVNGLPVAATQAAVGVDGDGRPWRLYHNLRPLQSTAPGCDASGTLDPLLATLRTDGNQIETLGPVEAWYWRDGDTLVPALRQRVREHKAGNAKASQVQLFARCDGEQELGRLGDQATTRPLHVADAGDMQVQARVFDPDPRTRLQDASLVWHDTLVLAEAAYQDPVPLPVSLQAGRYRLSGPHARVVDAMAPIGPYSSSDVQGFRLTRDDRGFADINAYYHLDLAQRHLKALGFTDLIPGALGIDTDAGYQDNSLYDPFERRLELGRSGVPDAEDPMVIWHEFGHGVQHHILPDLGKRDTGEPSARALATTWPPVIASAAKPVASSNPPWCSTGMPASPTAPAPARRSARPLPSGLPLPAHRTINGSNGDQLWGTRCSRPC